MAHAPVPTYIPLKYAARKYGIPEKTLLERVKSGSIASAQRPDGELLVAENNVDPSLNIKRDDFEHLRGQKISMSEASRKYQIAHANFSRWTKAGYIKVLERGWKVSMDEADVAYCVAIYNAKQEYYGGQLTGVPIFDENGDPYQAKYPEVAAYKRRVRLRQRQRETKDGHGAN